jgi:hypothetical protein
MITQFRDTNPMNKTERHNWLYVTAHDICARLIKKYITGEMEHATDLGNVETMTLLDELEAEHLDSLSYIAELRRRRLFGSPISRREDQLAVLKQAFRVLNALYDTAPPQDLDEMQHLMSEFNLFIMKMDTQLQSVGHE